MRKVMFERFSHVFHKKVQTVYFSVYYRMEATETEYCAFASEDFVCAGKVEHGVQPDKEEIATLIEDAMQTSSGFKRYMLYLLDKLTTTAHAEEMHEHEKKKRLEHKRRILERKAQKVNPVFECIIPGMTRPPQAYGINFGKPGHIVLKRGKKILVADNRGLRFYDNFPMPPLPESRTAIQLGEVILINQKFKWSQLISYMPQIRELFGETDLRVSDLVKGLTACIPESNSQAVVSTEKETFSEPEQEEYAA